MASIALHISQNGIETISFLDNDPIKREQTIKLYNFIKSDLEKLEKKVIQNYLSISQEESGNEK